MNKIKTSIFLLLFIASSAATVLGIELALDSKIVGSWVFLYKGQKRTYEFKSDKTFEGNYPVSGKHYVGTWKVDRSTIILIRGGETNDFATVTLNQKGEALFVNGQYTMTGQKAEPAATPAPATPAPTPSVLNDFRTKLFYEHLGEGMKNLVKNNPVGSSENGNAFTAIPDKPAVLVGLAFKKGDWFGTPIISAFQPIYEGQDGRFRGARVGKKVDDFPLVVEAKPGYAVSELIVCAPKNHVHGVKIVFRKLDFSHESLDADDSYESDWAGIEYNSKSAKVGDKVHPAVGLVGRADEWVASLGLVFAPSPH